MTDDPLSGHVPIARRELQALLSLAHSVSARLEAEREAVLELTELSDDLQREAVRRLAERGASEAQVERLEAAHREATRAAHGAASAVAAELAALTARLQELAEV